MIDAIPAEKPAKVEVRPNVDVWSGSVPQWVEVLVERMNAVAVLEKGWDGDRARPVTAHAAESALQVLQETMAPQTVAPAVVPVADGGLQLEWHLRGVDLEIYVEADGGVSAWCQEGVREWEEDFYPRARLEKELIMLTGDPD